MEKDYPRDLFDGVPRPPTVVREDRAMFADHEGTVYVEHGATLTLTGTLRGTLAVEAGAAAVIVGSDPGTLHVSRGAHVRVTGRQAGTTHNDGVLVIERDGAQRGSLYNTGRVTLRGEHAGALEDHGEFVVEPGGHLVPPTRVEGNVTIYEHGD